MCGIFCSLSCNDHVVPDSNTEQVLRNRGPDSFGSHKTTIDVNSDSKEPTGTLHATFLSTVLSLRGALIVDQPLLDAASNSVLCWNGEAWSIRDEPVAGNDSQEIFSCFLHASRTSSEEHRETSLDRVISVVEAIRGPFAFTFYDAQHQYLYYGRDCLGRRSLLQKSTFPDSLILSSVCDNASGDQWVEVEADGIYVIDLTASLLKPSLELMHIPQRRKDCKENASRSLMLPFPAMNRGLQDTSQQPSPEDVELLHSKLCQSLQSRVQHVRESMDVVASDHQEARAKVAILFSGGLDCTVLARITHELLPLGEDIDLLNVAFENPRVHKDLATNVTPYELCPDRITGASSYAELQRVCPGRRWRFVQIDVPYSETLAHRTRVLALMHPHNTEMDLSISYALYFASRGTGLVTDRPDGPSQPYSTAAHVLLSGLGADELFGGYQRHATAFTRQGYPGLIDELELDFNRLGKRNLGRDDRVISDSGKEVRFPYLDEEFISFALKLPVWSKCDFGNPQLLDSQEPARFLEPGKRILRLLAWKLRMTGAAAEKKRAIQFGSRTAKMETGKTKGTNVLS
ncbi:asparagine synthase-domain-containing protein [Lophiotrema nucula]|uniref:Asparagine synthase-domain-containing protein n=1 Tax=Lophiotrema nucula TaxID=690887 RepID=A0A6A5ZQ64_9PLEO|nr:asparagine synthase-domain-containing protein [Lophiotrema nucula]